MTYDKSLLSSRLGGYWMTQADLAIMTGIRPLTINELYHEITKWVNLEHLDLIVKFWIVVSTKLIVRVPNKENKIVYSRSGQIKPSDR